MFQVGQSVSWIARPLGDGGYLQGTVIKLGAKKICIEVKSKMGERRIKWVDVKSLKSV
jgi:hypothetical protein